MPGVVTGFVDRVGRENAFSLRGTYTMGKTDAIIYMVSGRHML